LFDGIDIFEGTDVFEEAVLDEDVAIDDFDDDDDDDEDIDGTLNPPKGTSPCTISFYVGISKVYEPSNPPYVANTAQA
jgi:hypothetical protein